MSSNYGYDANGWEREPFPSRDEHATRPNRVVDPKRALEVERRAAQLCDDAEPHVTFGGPCAAHRAEAQRAAPCERCQLGVGSTAPGPPHKASTPGHAPHCSCDGCF